MIKAECEFGIVMSLTIDYTQKLKISNADEYLPPHFHCKVEMNYNLRSSHVHATLHKEAVSVFYDGSRLLFGFLYLNE